MTDVIGELQRLRRERHQLLAELNDPVIIGSDEHPNADGVDYRYMRAVRIQQIDKKLQALRRESLKVV